MGVPLLPKYPRKMFSFFLGKTSILATFTKLAAFTQLGFAMAGQHDCTGEVCKPLYGAANPKMTCAPKYMVNADCSIFAHLQSTPTSNIQHPTSNMQHATC